MELRKFFRGGGSCPFSFLLAIPPLLCNKPSSSKLRERILSYLVSGEGSGKAVGTWKPEGTPGRMELSGVKFPAVAYDQQFHL